MDKFRLKLRIIFWILLGGVIFCLLFLGIVPFGKTTYIYNFSRKSDFISKLSPEDRVKPLVGGSQEVIGGPVYFTLRTPRRFEDAYLTLKYKASENVPIIEVGVLVDDVVWQYDLIPIENKIIDELASSWGVLMNGSVILLQRSSAERKYEHIEDFLSSPPDFKKIALYNYDLDRDIFLEGYEPEKSLKIIEDDIQGAYQFFTYVKNEDLYFNFTFADLNKIEGHDPINLLVYYKDKQIDTRYLEDDSSNEVLEKQLKLELKNLPEGFYKIGVRVSDDIITKKIETKQSKLAFINKINLARDEKCSGCAKKIYTDSKEIQVKTIYPDRLQTLLIKELFSPRSSYAREIEINETYKQFASKKIGSALSEITTASDGIILAGDGVFSFKEDSLVNPKFRRVDVNLNVDKEGINYIMAGYKLSDKGIGFKEASASFDLRGAALKDGEYKFIISAPSLKADDEIDDYVEIDEIKIELSGVKLGEKIKKILNF